MMPLSMNPQGLPSGNDILTNISKYGQAEVIIDYPGYDAMTELAALFSVSSCDGKAAILSLSPLTADAFISTAIPYRVITPEKVKSVYTASSAAEAMQWHAYPTWQQYDTIMHLLAERWPDACLLDTIGFSVMGRPILVLKISDNPAEDEDDEPAVMLSAAVHGDELAGFVLLMRLAEQLASGGNNNELVRKLTSGLEIWVNPLANPDGMYRTVDTILFPVRVNSNGYDINRNFPDPEVSSPPPLQPETTAMMAFMREKHFILSANLHSGAEVINYPWDKWTRLHADDQWFNDISRRYADTVHLSSDPGYLTLLDNGVTRGSVWYSIKGGRQDYITYELGGREVTMELDNDKQTPASQLESLWIYNGHSLIRYLEEALSGVTGTVTDAVTGMPVEAKIFIAGHDTDSSHVYSDILTGRFYRLLSPGIISFTVTSKGYEPYTAENVAVSWNEITRLDIELIPLDTIPDPPGTGLLIWPVPTTGEVSIMLPESLEGSVSLTVTSLAGALMTTYKTIVQRGIPFTHDFGYLGDGIYIVSVNKLPYGPVVRGKLIISTFTPF